MRPFQFDRAQQQAGTSIVKAQQSLNQRLDKALSCSNCLLVAPRYIEASFPFSKFGSIIIYSEISCKILPSWLSPANPKVHIFRVTDSTSPQQAQEVSESI